LIVLTRYRCPLNRLPASRLLLPHSGLERSDFVLWPDCEVRSVLQVCRLVGVDRKWLADRRNGDFDPDRTSDRSGMIRS
jgi:hypothetical protein